MTATKSRIAFAPLGDLAAATAGSTNTWLVMRCATVCGRERLRGGRAVGEKCRDPSDLALVGVVEREGDPGPLQLDAAEPL